MLKVNLYLGAYYRRKRAHLGPDQANVATAHKSARVVYTMLKKHLPYEAPTAADYDQQWEERQIAALKKKAAKLGFTLQTTT